MFVARCPWLCGAKRRTSAPSADIGPLAAPDRPRPPQSFVSMSFKAPKRIPALSAGLEPAAFRFLEMFGILG